jgi:hypothetical protein
MPARLDGTNLPVRAIGKYQSHAISMLAQAAYSQTIPVHAGRASLSYTTLAPARPATFCVEWNLTVEQRAKTIPDGIAVDVAIERPSAQRASDRA